MDNKVSTIEEAREFFGNPENAGKSCLCEKDGSDVTITSLEHAEDFFASIAAEANEAGTEATEDEVKAGNGEAAPAEETAEEKSDETDQS